MPAMRDDEHKIFLGSLDPGINKPKLLTLFEEFAHEPVDVIVPMVKPGKLAIAFMTWETPQAALDAVEAVHGLLDPKYSPCGIQVAMCLNHGNC